MKVQREINSSELHAQNSELPDGWRWVRLGEVCEIVTGSTPSTDDPTNWDGEKKKGLVHYLVGRSRRLRLWRAKVIELVKNRFKKARSM